MQSPPESNRSQKKGVFSKMNPLSRKSKTPDSPAGAVLTEEEEKAAADGVAAIDVSDGAVDTTASAASASADATSDSKGAAATNGAAAAAAGATAAAGGKPMAGFTTLGAQGLQLLDGDGTGFELRIGPDYKKEKKKAPSLPHIYAPLSIDVFKRSAIAFHVADKVTLPPPPDGAETPNTTGLPRRIVCNVIIPVDGPPLLGGNNDGSCSQVVVVFGASAEALAAYQAEGSPAYKLFERFIKNAPTGVLPSSGDLDVKERLKLLPRLDNMSSLGLPGWIQGYNGKPALLQKSGALFRGDDYLEIDLNTFRFAKMTRMGVHQLMPRIKDFDLHVAITLEGRDNEELPERALLACRIRGLNMSEIGSEAEL